MYFDFVLPRNTKQKSLNMVLNSNDRFHNQEKGKITRRIRNLPIGIPQSIRIRKGLFLAPQILVRLWLLFAVLQKAS